MPDKTRIGLIGIGKFSSSYHIPNLLKRDDVEITAVCDVDPERLRARDERLSQSAEYTNYRALLDAGLVDAAVISTPNVAHFEPCRAALQQGLPVLIDKSLTMTSGEAQELVDLSKEQGVVLMTAFTRHFMTAAQIVRQRISDGSIGAVQMISAVQCRHMPAQYSTNGSMLFARAVHIADLCPWLADLPVTAVEATMTFGDHGYEKLADIRMTLGDSIPARLLCIQDCEHYLDEVTVYGERASYQLHQRNLHQIEGRNRWSSVAVEPDRSNSSAHFIDVLRGQAESAEPNVADLHSEDGLKAVQVLEAALESARRGERITLSV